MKTFLQASILSLCLAGAAVAPAAAEPVAGVPAVIVADQATLEWKVEAIDQATRKVTLKAADGTMSVLTAGPRIKNLAQVKVGDTLKVQYTEALRLHFTTGGALRQKEVVSDSATAASGAMPGAAAGREVHFVADITAVDPATGALTLRGPQRTLDVTVKNKAALKKVKVGDQVAGTFVQVAAIAVVPGK